MTIRTGITTAALLCLAILLLALGAAARPLLISDTPATTPILDDIEIGFAQDMLAHHTQALIMVSSLDNSAGPAVLGLARRIENTQRTESGELLGWLRLAGAPTVNPHPMAWMHRSAATGSHHHNALPTTSAEPGSETMPGMATRAELDALSAARGEAAGTLFLQLMQRHHYGALLMTETAETLLSSGVVKQTARDMGTGESQEIGLMGMLLDSAAAGR